MYITMLLASLDVFWSPGSWVLTVMLYSPGERDDMSSRKSAGAVSLCGTLRSTWVSCHDE